MVPVRAVQQLALEVDRDDGRNLVIYQRMSTLGWYYVVMGPSTGLL